jgi:hypothetical protein
MLFTPPPDSEILAAFTQLSSLDPLDSGGFKAVYKASVGGKLEIFKLVCLPSGGQTEEQRSYRHESIGRIRREVELLGRCRAPELVKLGSLDSRSRVNRSQRSVELRIEESFSGRKLRSYVLSGFVELS